jgi:hypothetical protein
MTTPALMTEHGACAGQDTNDAYYNVKAHDSEEDRVNRGNRNTEHNGRVTGHVTH